MTNQDAQTPPEPPQAPQADEETIAALERLAPRARQVLVTGVTLIVLGTAALTVGLCGGDITLPGRLESGTQGDGGR